MKKLIALCFILSFVIQASSAQIQNIKKDKRLKVVAKFLHYQPIGVAVSNDNRVFVSFPHLNKDYKYGLVEIKKGKAIPFPNKSWNEKGDENSHFISVQDLCCDRQGNLWVLDSKPSPKNSIFGNSKGKAEGQFKLLKINLSENKVEHVYRFPDLNKQISGLNDVRIDTDHQLAYLSDPGQKAIVVLNLSDGHSRTVLQNDKSTVADPRIRLSYNGQEMDDPDGVPFSSNVNGIALTYDNKYLYYKPINGNYLYKIATKELANRNLSPNELSKQVVKVASVGITHGLIADKKGNIYLTNSMDYCIYYLSPDGKRHLLVRDPRLLWPDSLGIGTDGYLYFSCSQLHLQPHWNNGHDKTKSPYYIFRISLP